MKRLGEVEPEIGEVLAHDVQDREELPAGPALGRGDDRPGLHRLPDRPREFLVRHLPVAVDVQQRAEVRHVARARVRDERADEIARLRVVERLRAVAVERREHVREPGAARFQVRVQARDEALLLRAVGANQRAVAELAEEPRPPAVGGGRVGASVHPPVVSVEHERLAAQDDILEVPLPRRPATRWSGLVSVSRLIRRGRGVGRSASRRSRGPGARPPRARQRGRSVGPPGRERLFPARAPGRGGGCFSVLIAPRRAVLVFAVLAILGHGHDDHSEEPEASEEVPEPERAAPLDVDGEEPREELLRLERRRARVELRHHQPELLDVQPPGPVRVHRVEDLPRVHLVRAHERVERRERGRYLVVPVRDDGEARVARLANRIDEGVEREPLGERVPDRSPGRARPVPVPGERPKPEHGREVPFLRRRHAGDDVQQQSVELRRAQRAVAVDVVRAKHVGEAFPSDAQKLIQTLEQILVRPLPGPGRRDQAAGGAAAARAVRALLHARDAGPLAGMRQRVVRHVRLAVDEEDARVADALLVELPRVHVLGVEHRAALGGRGAGGGGRSGRARGRGARGRGRRRRRARGEIIDLAAARRRRHGRRLAAGRGRRGRASRASAVASRGGRRGAKRGVVEVEPRGGEQGGRGPGERDGIARDLHRHARAGGWRGDADVVARERHEVARLEPTRGRRARAGRRGGVVRHLRRAIEQVRRALVPPLLHLRDRGVGGGRSRMASGGESRRRGGENDARCDSSVRGGRRPRDADAPAGAAAGPSPRGAVRARRTEPRPSPSRDVASAPTARARAGRPLPRNRRAP